MFRRAALLAILLLPLPSPSQDLPRSVTTILDSNCFQLRDRTRIFESSLARGALSAAFNDPKHAESDLTAITAAAPKSAEAFAANLLLAAMFGRMGSARSTREYAIQAASFGGGPGPATEGILSLYDVLARYPDPQVTVRSPSRLSSALREDGIAIPVSLNGKQASFLLDSRSGISVLQESGAKSLGIAIHDDRFSLTDATGHAIPCRLGIAADFAAGAFRMRNVPFCVSAAAGIRNILGLPILIAFETIRWSRAGSIEIGFASTTVDIKNANACFNGAGLAIEIEVSRKHLSFDLDTGNPRTFLYSRFAADFAETAKAAPRTTFTFQGLGDPSKLSASELPSLPVKLRGMDAVLHNVPLLNESIDAESVFSYGNAGRDLFASAAGFTLDLKAMTFTLAK